MALIRSQELCDFVSRCFWYPEMRPAAAELLVHPFVQLHTGVADLALTGEPTPTNASQRQPAPANAGQRQPTPCGRVHTVWPCTTPCA